MDPAIAAALGLLQGLTEFLPVSSSGHVSMGALLFGVPDMPLSMVIVVHAGTFVATLLVVGRDVGQLTAESVRGLRSPREFLATERGRIVMGVIVATVPTGIIGLSIKDQVETWSHSPTFVAVCFIITAAILWTTRSTNGGQKVTLTYAGYFLLGIAQGVAVLPGISRSGTTIAAAMLLGMKPGEAFRFSFLLSLPAVLGAVVLELRHPEVLSALGSAAFIAGGVATIVGWGSLLLLRRVVDSGRLWMFSLYLIPLGTGLMIWDLTS
jgi:undecaprenyl-diphosphatase